MTLIEFHQIVMDRMLPSPFILSVIYNIRKAYQGQINSQILVTQPGMEPGISG